MVLGDVKKYEVERSGEMLNDKFSILMSYIASYEGIATMLIVLIMLLKALINQKVSALKFKKMIVSFPGELVFLVMGFLFSDMINSNKTGSDTNKIMASIVIAFIILVFEHALERWLDDKISGSVKKRIRFVIAFMYFISIFFYIGVVFLGGAHNG